MYSLPFLEWLAWEGQQECWEPEHGQSNQTNPSDDAEAGRALEDVVEPVSESVRDTEMALEVGGEHDNEENEPNQRNDEARQHAMMRLVSFILKPRNVEYVCEAGLL